jgi:trimeric autotransporter adhesin
MTMKNPSMPFALAALLACAPRPALAQFNEALGTGALLGNTGNGNVALGDYALSASTSGSWNTATGIAALAFNTTGYGNTATGYQSLYANTIGIENTALGFQTLTSNLSGFANTASGFRALHRNQGNSNSAHGHQALTSNSEGNANTATGAAALALNTFGNFNTAHGWQALISNFSGNSNTAAGAQSLANNTTGGFNTALGSSALISTTTGSQNTAVGNGAHLNNATGSGNTALGAYAGVGAGNLANATAIGYNAIVDASNKVRIGNADVTVIQGQVAFTASSDRNLKENFLAVDGAAVLRKLMGFNLTSWNYIGHDAKQHRHYGPMAQDFHAAFGRDGKGEIGTPTTINSGDISGILMVAAKELAKENVAMKKRLAELDARDREREARLAKLEQQLEAMR